VQFAKDADVLIHDAQYLEAHYRGQLAGFPATQGYGHSTVTMACEVAAAAEVGQLILFHHDPSYTDAIVTGMEASARAQFSESQAAYEGLEIVLHGASTACLDLHSAAPLSATQRDVKYANHDRHQER
jgi:ribonuclease BN (tRNA processing enzyme)